MKRFRQVMTWLLFAASLVGVGVSCQWIGMAVYVVGANYPHSVSPALPLLTAWLLGHLSYLFAFGCTVVVGALLGVGLALRFATSSDVRLHIVSLITSLVYHVTVMLWAFFVITFFVLPHARAGI